MKISNSRLRWFLSCIGKKELVGVIGMVERLVEKARENNHLIIELSQEEEDDIEAAEYVMEEFLNSRAMPDITFLYRE